MKNLVIEGQSLEWLLASATDAMLIIDGEGCIVLANPALERLFGYSGEQLLGQRIEMLVPARLREAHTGLRSAYLQQPRARSMGGGAALTGQHHDGREFPVEVSLSPLQSDPAAPLVLAIDRKSVV